MLARFTWALGVTTLVIIGSATAQIADPVTFVRGLYLKYLAVEPPADQLQFWVTAMRNGKSSLEIHAAILGSEPYYAIHGRNPDAFVNAAFAQVYNRRPTPNERGFWNKRLRDLGNDRIRWSLEFLQGANVPLFPGNPPPIPPADAPTQLVTLTQLLVQSSNQECPGQPGWLLRNQANNLVAAAVAGRPVLANPNRDPALTQLTLRNIESGIEGMREGLANTGFPAPATRLHLQQLDQVLGVIRGNFNPPPPNRPFPLPRPPISGGITPSEFERIARLAANLDRETQQTVYLLRRSSNRDWGTEGLLRDVEAFAHEVDDFRLILRPGVRKEDLRSRALLIRRDAEVVNRRLRTGSFDVRVYQSWHSTAEAYNNLASTLGVADTNPPNPSVNPGGNFPPGAIEAIDLAVAACETLHAGFAPYMFYHPSVPRLQAEIRGLQSRYVSLRRLLTTDPDPRMIQDQMGRLTSELQSINRTYFQVITVAQLPSPPDIARLNRAADVVRRLLQNR